MTALNEMERERDSLRAFVAVAGDSVESDDIRRLLELDAQITDARAVAAAKQEEKPAGQLILDAMRSHRRVVPAANSRPAETDTTRGVERIRKGLAGPQNRGS